MFISISVYSQNIVAHNINQSVHKHRIRNKYKGNSAVQRVHYILCKIMQFTGQKAEQPAGTAYLLARKCNRLARTCIMNMRNATCVRTQTSKDPTRVALLFISYSMAQAAQVTTVPEEIY